MGRRLSFQLVAIPHVKNKATRIKLEDESADFYSDVSGNSEGRDSRLRAKESDYSASDDCRSDEPLDGISNVSQESEEKEKRFRKRGSSSSSGEDYGIQVLHRNAKSARNKGVNAAADSYSSASVKTHESDSRPLVNERDDNLSEDYSNEYSSDATSIDSRNQSIATTVTV